jgi:MFS family permease
MPDPPRGRSQPLLPKPDEVAGVVPTAVEPQPAAAPARGPSGLETYRRLLTIPSYTLNTLGMTMMTFAIGGLAYWMPAYLEERGAQGLFGLGPRTTFGAITALSGLVATLSGGLLGDWLRRYFSGSYFLVSGIALIVGFPMVLGVLYAPFPAAWVFMFFAVFCLFFNTGPTNTILANVTHPSVRASAFALNILIIHALGDAISPPIIGYIADKSSLHAGFVVVSAAMLIGGVFWLMGMKFLQRDMARAE